MPILTITEFFIPLTSNDSIDNQRVKFYKNELKQNKKPTAISLTVLDVKEPAIFEGDEIKSQFTSHWCLAHYIIDGHHKLKAASEMSTEITLLSFIAKEKGISSNEEILEVIQKLT